MAENRPWRTWRTGTGRLVKIFEHALTRVMTHEAECRMLIEFIPIKLQMHTGPSPSWMTA